MELWDNNNMAFLLPYITEIFVIKGSNKQIIGANLNHGRLVVGGDQQHGVFAVGRFPVSRRRRFSVQLHPLWQSDAPVTWSFSVTLQRTLQRTRLSNEFWNCLSWQKMIFLVAGMGRTGSTVPAVHTSPLKFRTCNRLEVLFLRLRHSKDLYWGPVLGARSSHIRGLVDWGLVVIWGTSPSLPNLMTRPFTTQGRGPVAVGARAVGCLGRRDRQALRHVSKQAPRLTLEWRTRAKVEEEMIIFLK